MPKYWTPALKISAWNAKRLSTSAIPACGLVECSKLNIRQSAASGLDSRRLSFRIATALSRLRERILTHRGSLYELKYNDE
jgi:hypothetical protein